MKVINLLDDAWTYYDITYNLLNCKHFIIKYKNEKAYGYIFKILGILGILNRVIAS